MEEKRKYDKKKRPLLRSRQINFKTTPEIHSRLTKLSELRNQTKSSLVEFAVKDLLAVWNI